MKGLSTGEAISKLYDNVVDEVTRERRKLRREYPSSIGPLRWLAITHSRISSSSYCLVYATCLLICSLLMSVGALQNGFHLEEALPASIMFVFTLLNVFLSNVLLTRRRFEITERVDEILKSLKLLKDSASPSISYSPVDERTSESISFQWTFRDGKVVNVPWMLLVKGDVILVRPGHCSPCWCISSDGRLLYAGEKIPLMPTRCNETDAVIPLEPQEYTVLEAPLTQHLRNAFSEHSKRRTNLLDADIRRSMHSVVEHFVLPLASFTLMLLLLTRQWLLVDLTESWLQSVSVFAVTLMPLLGPAFPVFCFVIKYWNLACIVGSGRFSGERDFCSTYRSSLSVFIENPPHQGTIFTDLMAFCHFFTGRSNILYASSDVVFNLGGLTTVAFIDKKGILSWPNATAEKLFFFRKRLSQEGEAKLVPEILDLTLNAHHPFILHFDDPNWEQFRKSLLPMVENAILSSCVLHPKYTRFMDHVSAISDHVPRTSIFPSDECLCYLERLIGLSKAVLGRFDVSTRKTLGAYKKSSEHGLRKHHTPLENAFITLARDAHSLQYHIMSRGTAELLLNACSHIWTGETLEPITRAARKKVIDFYQRHSMTGYCTVMTYGTCGCDISERMSGRYIDVPLRFGQGDSRIGTVLPRSLSVDSASLTTFFRSPLTSNDECLEVLLENQVFCGLIVMQYQARGDAVRLVEQFGNACVRFVYFSRENELRSRVFAEKLGLEAGWNCHISLASEGSDEWERQQFERSGGVSERSFLSAHPISKSSCNQSLFVSRPNLSGHSSLVFIRDTSTTNSARNAEPSSQSRHNATVRPEGSLNNSPSKPSLGSWTDDFGPTVMPNKAQLPSGIKNIRPHLRNVDNVPLLVNLFTDSDHHTSREMIEIMQDHGEVVLVVGSSLNFHNGRIFSQGNSSICVEPQEPALCCNEPTKTQSEDLSASTDLILLISACRYRLRLSRSAMSFFLQSTFFVYILQFISLLAFAPSMFTTFQMFIFTCVYIPLIGLAITAAPSRYGDCVGQISQKNSAAIPWKAMRRMIFSLLLVYLPSASFVAAIYLIAVMTSSPALESAAVVHAVSHVSRSQLVHTARHSAAFLFTVFICIMSADFVFVRHNVWERCPFRNRVWVVCCVLSIMMQVVYTTCSLESFDSLREWCSVAVIATTFGWVVFMAAVNAIHKFRQVKLYARDQRRRKLCFNTKLGMNSPY